MLSNHVAVEIDGNLKRFDHNKCDEIWHGIVWIIYYPIPSQHEFALSVPKPPFLLDAPTHVTKKGYTELD